MTYVLILIFMSGYKGGMATIPGYASEEACRMSGAQYVRQAKVIDALAYCVPGPR